MKLLSLVSLTLTLLTSTTHAWLPNVDKMRGVNFGGLFVSEPWMMNDEWNAMGCGGTVSEFDCMIRLGQAAGDAAFQHHYDTYYTQADIQNIASLGLNTVRIPVGYWIREDIVYRDSERFPQGGFPYLRRICQWAKDAGLYIIIDLHGAPGAQVKQQPFTGQYAPTAGFYVDYQYERAYKFLEWMTTYIHTDAAFSNVGTIGLVNEPIWDNSLIYSYYPTAWNRIRAAENSLGVPQSSRIHIQMMNEKWGAGNPLAGLSDLWYAFYDDHHYVKWTDTVPATRDAYMRHSCTDSRSGNWKVVVGEWSISPADENNYEFDINRSDAKDWYRKWWLAQTISYEKVQGWIYWSWKVQNIGGRMDWRWGYKNAVDAGVIPRNANAAVGSTACNGYT